MKAKLLFLSLISAALLTAQADAVYSNAVGMVSFELERGTLTMLSLPFILEDETLTAEELAGDTLPFGTTIYFWDSVNQVWVGNTYEQGLFGSPDSWGSELTEYSRGDGIFIRIPSEAPEENYTLVISGDVPSEATAPTTIRELESGKLYLVGSGYPVSLTVSDTKLGLNPSPGDTIIIWDNDQGGYVGSTFEEGLFGSPDAWTDPDLEIPAGKGFFYRSMVEQTWLLDKSQLYTLQ